MILSILDIKKNKVKYNFKKTVFIYILLGSFTILVNQVYGIFGHGVSSDAMTWMFLYPLVGGGVYLLLGLLLPNISQFSGYRLFCNTYNSGIAALTTGSLLKGIMEIAGTNSSYLKYYYLIGYVMLVIAFVLLSLLALNYKRINMNQTIAE